MQNNVAFVIIGILVLIIIGLSTKYFEPTETTTTTTTTIQGILTECTDSDGGAEYFIKGVVHSRQPGSSGSYYDICKGVKLDEWVCGPNNAPVKIEYYCSNGCNNGACINVSTEIYSSKELNCIYSGGTVRISLCCKSVNNLPNTCLIGACGCSPSNSHEVQVCECPQGKCFDGNRCVERSY